MNKLILSPFSKDEIKEMMREVVREELDSTQTKEEYLTQAQVANLLNVTYRTVQNHVRNRKLKSCSIGGRKLFKRSDIEKMLNK